RSAADQKVLARRLSHRGYKIVVENKRAIFWALSEFATDNSCGPRKRKRHFGPGRNRAFLECERCAARAVENGGRGGCGRGLFGLRSLKTNCTPVSRSSAPPFHSLWSLLGVRLIWA